MADQEVPKLDSPKEAVDVNELITSICAICEDSLHSIVIYYDEFAVLILPAPDGTLHVIALD